ncbi:hypothetical protein CR513_62098, partial [Mucuna pruriens]
SYIELQTSKLDNISDSGKLRQRPTTSFFQPSSIVFSVKNTREITAYAPTMYLFLSHVLRLYANHISPRFWEGLNRQVLVVSHGSNVTPTSIRVGKEIHGEVMDDAFYKVMLPHSGQEHPVFFCWSMVQRHQLLPPFNKGDDHHSRLYDISPTSTYS